jgi:predicted  nucleic acid-binding Zn-ribbon protein
VTSEASVLDALQRENRYLKARNAELQSDVTSLAGEAQRLREELERLHGRVALRRPNPLSGGQ